MGTVEKGGMMGGFAELKKDFECLVTLRPDGYAPDADRDRNQDDIVYRYLMLRCLFEIAGNLDTIAVESRKISKILQDMSPVQSLPAETGFQVTNWTEKPK